MLQGAGRPARSQRTVTPANECMAGGRLGPRECLGGHGNITRCISPTPLTPCFRQSACWKAGPMLAPAVEQCTRLVPVHKARSHTRPQPSQHQRRLRQHCQCQAAQADAAGTSHLLLAHHISCWHENNRTSPSLFSWLTLVDMVE